MSVFKARGGYVSKFQYQGKQHWTPGGPWQTKRQATEAERRHRDRLESRRTEETCASFAGGGWRNGRVPRPPRNACTRPRPDGSPTTSAQHR